MYSNPEIFANLASEIASLHLQPPPDNVLPSEHVVTQARDKLCKQLPQAGLGFEETIRHIREDLAPGFNGSSRSPNYYGFVTGGSTPAAALADNLVTIYDQNAAVHLPKESIATNVEDAATSLLAELLKLGTVSNVDHEHYWNLIDNTYVDDVSIA